MFAIKSVLENSGLFLKPSDVLHDVVHITRFDSIDLRHVAKLPMMSLYSVGRRSLKRFIAMMIRFIDLVKKGRALSSSDSADPMAE